MIFVCLLYELFLQQIKKQNTAPPPPPGGGGGGHCRAADPPRIEIKKKTLFVGMISSILRDSPFSRHQLVKSKLEFWNIQ
jgi:hypothetical protein